MEMRLVMEGSTRPVSSTENFARHGSISKSVIWEKYERVVQAAKSQRKKTRRISVLTFWNRFLGYCAVTWASVVVLGAFVADMPKEEFLRASFLLLLQALYLAYTTSWSYMFTRLSDVAFYLARISVSPRLPGTAWSRFLYRARGILFFELTFSTSLVCMLFSFYKSVAQLSKHHLRGSGVEAGHDAALKIFYVLMLINALVAYVHAWASVPTIGARQSPIWEISYFYRAIKSCQGNDNVMIGSGEVELIDFVYDMMSDECRGLIEIGHLYALCVELVPYVYYHPRGFQATISAMGSPDHFVQEAAILMVGFLVHLESQMADSPRVLRLQEPIVRRLRDLGTGNDAVQGPRKKAALWSLLMLARHDPQALMIGISPFLHDLVEVVSTILMDLGAHDSGIQDHDGLLALFDILNAVLRDENCRVRFTTRQKTQSLHLSELIKRVQTSSDHELRPASPLAKAATLTFNLLQNASVPDLQDGEIADLNSAGIKANRWCLRLLSIFTLGLIAILTVVCDIIYDKALSVDVVQPEN